MGIRVVSTMTETCIAVGSVHRHHLLTLVLIKERSTDNNRGEEQCRSSREHNHALGSGCSASAAFMAPAACQCLAPRACCTSVARAAYGAQLACMQLHGVARGRAWHDYKENFRAS